MRYWCSAARSSGQLTAADRDVVERQDLPKCVRAMIAPFDQSRDQRSAFGSEYCATCTIARMSSSVKAAACLAAQNASSGSRLANAATS